MDRQVHNIISTRRLALAKWLYASRDGRPGAPLAGLYGEPVWDILLDLYIVQCSERRISVSAACAAARAPSTTALRYIRLLRDNGLIERFPDESDRRRLWLRLTPDALHAMDHYLDKLLDTLDDIR